MTALGLLCTDHRGEDDYPRIEQLLGSDIRVDLVRAGAPGADPADALGAAAEELRLTGAEAVVRAGQGFADDVEDETRQVEELARQTGMPASTTALAFVNAARESGVTRVAVAAAAGSHEQTARLRGFLRAGGLTVTGVHTPEAAGDDEDALTALAVAADTADAEAVLLTDPALCTAAHLPALEKAVGKPVLTSSQVTVWEGLRLADRRVHAPDLGTLFTRTPPSGL